MDSIKSSEIDVDFSPHLIIYKDGHVEEHTPYSPENNLTLRLYLPKNTQNQKLPLLVYFHGGGVCIESAFSSLYHTFLNSFVSEANIIAASVEYKQAPENPVPCPHDDSWTSLKWIASHSDGKGTNDWLNRHADFQRVFFSGDSAGGNIVHRMGLRHGLDKLEGVNVGGIILVHPFFWGKKPVADGTDDVNLREKLEGMRRFTCPTTSGFDDPLINSAFDPNLASLGTNRGWYYTEILKKSGWGGEADVMESKGEDHCFHLTNPTSENAVALLKKFVSFINQD
ncbi:hypothetical protein ACOSP7_024980 [Xanthoceras sorbifolium]